MTMKLKEYEVEFEVNQRFLYSMSVKSLSAEMAIEKVQDIEFDRYEAEDDCMLESEDDLTTVKIIGEWNKEGNRVWLKRYDKHIKCKPTPFQIYKESQGNKCPFCNSANIISLEFNSSDLEAWRDVSCRTCERTYREFFTMTYIEEL